MSTDVFVSSWRRSLACGVAALIVVLGCTITPVSAQSGPAWWERIDLGGDFRERQEGFFQDGATTRQRLRFRLRLTMNADVNDDVRFGLRLGSGDLGNPTSTNQSFGDLLTRKPISVDRAFIAYNPSGAKALTLGAGKFGIPVTRTEMTWDNDVNWEGVYQQLRASSGPVSYRLVAAQVVLDESSRQDDSMLFVGYGEVGFTFGKHELQLSVADQAFGGVDPVAIVLATEDIGRNTNALDVDRNGQVVGFVSGFNLVDVIARATFDIGRPNYPVQFTANFVKNTDAGSDDDRGVWLTAAYGRASTPRTYRLAYTLARIERDAVLSTFNFSDAPGTNMRMHRTVVSYMLARGVHLDFIGIFTKKLMVAPGELNTLLKRTQLDVRFAF